MARAVAWVEPHYRMLVVSCPGCQAVAPCSARRDHPIARGWRQFKQMGLALSYLFLAVLSGLVCLAIMDLTIYATAGDLRGVGLSPAQWVGLDSSDSTLPAGLAARFHQWRSEGGWVTASLGLFASAAFGTWIQSVLHHLRPTRRWVLGISAVMLGAALPLVVMSLGTPQLVQPTPQYYGWGPAPAEPSTGWSLNLGELLAVTAVAALASAGTLLGTFAGDLVAWTQYAATARLWRWKLRLARKRRNA